MKTLAATVAVVLALVGAGFAVQALALLPPPKGALVSLRASTWLGRYRLVTSRVELARGRTFRAVCMQQWFTDASGRRRLGAVVRLDDGFLLIDLPPHTLVMRGGTAADRAVPPLVLLELAGCPRLLARGIENLTRVRLVHVSKDANTVRFRLHGTQLALSVDRHSGRPLALAVTSRRARGTSRFRYERLTPQLLRRLGAKL